MSKKVKWLVTVVAVAAVIAGSVMVGSIDQESCEQEMLIKVQVKGADVECFEWKVKPRWSPVWIDNGLWCQETYRPR